MLQLVYEFATSNKSPKPTLENVAALRGCFSGSAAWLKRYSEVQSQAI